jgi:hypothetical protein
MIMNDEFEFMWEEVVLLLFLNLPWETKENHEKHWWCMANIYGNVVKTKWEQLMFHL